jgi:WXG100 family type VII secretion target
MGHIRADPEELRHLSDVFADNGLVLQMMLIDVLKAEMLDLDTQWMGETKKSFYARWVDLLAIMQEMKDLMDTIASALNQGAMALHDADRTAVGASE